jgi:acyl dehydratase
MTKQIVTYFEDVVPGMSLEFGHYRMSEEEIVAFARAYDPQPFHLGREAARDSVVGELIASGWHTCAAAMRMIVDHFNPAESLLPSPGVDEIRWLVPVRPGDELSVRLTIVDSRASQSKPDRGIFRLRTEVFNQKREIVLTFSSINFMRKRPVAEKSG